MKSFYFIILLFASTFSFSQQIQNVHCEQQGKQIVITYDISDAQADQKFDVKLYYSQDINNWKSTSKGLSGDIGTDISVGINKKINWDVLKEVEMLVGKGFMFKIKTTINSNTSGSFTDMSNDNPYIKKNAKINSNNSNSNIVGSFIDIRDGKTYKWVKIGNQKWMAENLNFTTQYSSKCYQDKKNNCKKYGRLYDWYSANKACPNGWHLPTDNEWSELIDYLNGENEAGGKLKESGTEHWISPNVGADNSSGFRALPGGWINDEGREYGLGISSYWWSATKNGNTTSHRFLNNIKSNITKESSGTVHNFSVRCVKE